MEEEMVDATVTAFGPIRHTSCVIEVRRTPVFGNRSGHWAETTITWWHFRSEWRWFKRTIQMPRKQAVLKMYDNEPDVWGTPCYEPPY